MARDAGLRDRIREAIRGIEVLYGTAAPVEEDQGDLRRRRFAQSRHNVWPTS
jgi:hypothetical protein